MTHSDTPSSQQTAPSTRLQRWLWLALCLSLCGCFFLMLFANGYDWDMFYTNSEIDLRGWLEGHPPLWSYQYCGGITRAGDPESFGLSPLFVLILLFGAFWGTKLLLWGAMLFGVYYTARLLQLFSSTPEAISPTQRLTSYMLAFLFVSSNGFLWHFVMGHATYALVYLGVGLIYYTLKAWKGRWHRKDWLPALVLTFSYYAAGFYIAQVFFLLPFFVGLGLLLLFELLQSKDPKAWLQRTWQMVGFHLIGLLLASYKLVYILHYQKHFPRVVNNHEPVDLSFLLLSPFLPTIDHKIIGLGTLTGYKRIWVWEYSFFHLAGWGLLVTLLVALWHQKQLSQTKEANDTPPPPDTEETPETKDNTWLLLGVVGVVVLGFALGDTVPWSLHSLLNHHLLKHSIRVVDRYQIGFVFLLHFAWGVVLLRHTHLCDFFLKWMALPAILLMLWNWSTFGRDLRPTEFHHFTKVAGQSMGPKQMTTMILSYPHARSKGHVMMRSHQYHLARAGLGFPYCYKALTKDKRTRNALMHIYLMRQQKLRQAGIDPRSQRQKIRAFSFIATELTPVSKECLQKSRFTQHRIVLHKSCPQDICLNVSQANLYAPQGFSYHRVAGRVCRGGPKLRRSQPGSQPGSRPGSHPSLPTKRR